MNPTASAVVIGVKAPALNVYAVKHEASALEKAQKMPSSVTFRPQNTPKKGRNAKHHTIAVTHKPRVDPCQVLICPLLTESTTMEIETKNTLTFIVDVHSDKTGIKAAVQELYGVQVKKINTVIRPDGKKKAFVQLKPDYSAADVVNWAGVK